jgi:hypothetical protein
MSLDPLVAIRKQGASKEAEDPEPWRWDWAATVLEWTEGNGLTWTERDGLKWTERDGLKCTEDDGLKWT